MHCELDTRTHVRKHVCWLVIRLYSCNTYDRRARLITSTVHSNVIEIISNESVYVYSDSLFRWTLFFCFFFHYANDELLCRDELVCEHSDIEHMNKYTFKCVLAIWMKYEIAWSYMNVQCSYNIHIYSPLFLFCAPFAVCSLFKWNQMYEEMALPLSYTIWMDNVHCTPKPAK